MIVVLLASNSGSNAVMDDIHDIAHFSSRNYLLWALYDFANTLYSTGILTLTAYTWFLVVGFGSGFDFGSATSIYSVALFIAGVVIAVFMPFLGAFSDLTQNRKWFVLLFTGLSLIFLAIFWFVGSNQYNVWFTVITFSISLICYQWSGVFYDAMMPGLIPPGKEGRLNSIAVGFGFLGGIIPLGYGFLFSSSRGDPNSDPAQGDVILGYLPDMVILIILLFGLMTIPLAFVAERDWKMINDTLVEKTGEKGKTVLHMDEIPEAQGRIFRASFIEMWETIKHIYYKNRGMLFYIVAYFILADIANLVGALVAEYLRLLGLPENEVNGIIATGLIGILTLSIVQGFILDQRGAKYGFGFVFVLWTVGLLFFLSYDTIVSAKIVLYLASFMVTPALAGIWIAQRQMVLEQAPNEEYIGKYFGLTKFSGKMSAAFGPILWAISINFFTGVVNLTNINSFRLSLIILALTAFVGFYILYRYVPNKFQDFRERRNLLKDVSEGRVS